MTTAEEHRHIAEEFFRMAREAETEEERKRFFDMALSWLEAATREDGRFWIGSCALKR
jgi:hypothetical protein